MNLDENQKKSVAVWLSEGSSLAEVQSRLESEFGATLTYMEVKFLVADLDLTPVDPEPETPAEPDAGGSSDSAEAASVDSGEGAPEEEPAAGSQPVDDPDADLTGTGAVSVDVDQLARPGSMISGKVTFGNGKTSEWMLDQMGRLGVVPSEDGYKPSQTDLQQFQSALQDELERKGL